MSYQVLARKWRPKSFGTLIGQDHVVRALSHALETGRLHHAWLFTGTRGVGKTTISRILAKALNCETGVTAEPCGHCPACLAIDADRFPDYVEMDAASNRGVDDMAALLEQAVYAPVQGRYKVYMIDEVHMLTGHAFNAMLKTLEEPPGHVKFILATTDPQKIPVTVLSRCLQFNLKQMAPGHIVDHLGRILEAEHVPCELPALRHIAKAAAGSMRDALSLLDQAIAHGGGRIETEQVANMLGTVGDEHLHAVLDALLANDARVLLEVADGMEARSLSFDAALQALASLVHRIAMIQFAPTAVADAAERELLMPYAQAFDPEYLQLAYQIAIRGRDELPLAPDEYAGFTMTLLRLHAFRPEQPAPLESGGQPGGGLGRASTVTHPVGNPSSPAVATPSAAPRIEGASRAEGARAEGASRAPIGGQNGAPPMVVPAAGVRAIAGESPQSAAGRGDVADDAAVKIARSPGTETHRAVNEPMRSRDVPPWEALPPEADVERDSSFGESVREGAPVLVPDKRPSDASAGDESGLGDDRGSPRPPGQLQATIAHAPACDNVNAALAAGDWHAVLRLMKLGGMVRELAQHCEWKSLADDLLTIRLSRTHHHLLDVNPGLAGRLADQLSEYAARSLRLKVELGEIAGETPAQRDAAEKRARHVEAVAALERDPFVRELIERFDATLIETSITPL